MRAALSGRPVDRPPVSFWGYDFFREWSLRDLANSGGGHRTIRLPCIQARRRLRVLARYAAEAVAAGAAGIFCASVDWATRDLVDEPFYREHDRRHDLQVLHAVRDATFNVLHVCRADNLLELTFDYPVAAFNRATTEDSNMSLGGGLGTDGQGRDRRDRSAADGDRSRRRARCPGPGGAGRNGRGRHLVGAGCAISPLTPPETIGAVPAAVRG